ncbi:hypothetical protein [Streptomyces murinus]|uniref:hypothetical protein n=1 Tax=Streptomyces murinus TaxID=33900 RepID=UPI0018F4827D|nr:hypothetical protein [Streptomyces murinus]
MTATETPLALLPLPEYNTLTERQARGLACVWCREGLTDTPAVNLGKHTIRRIDTRTSWYPRACPQCAQTQAMRELMHHTQSCEPCVDDHTQCPTGHGLVRAVREARR